MSKELTAIKNYKSLNMEAFMKNITFFIIVLSFLFVTASAVYANTDNEYSEALKYYNSGKFNKAVSLLKDYIKNNQDPSAYYRIGYALYKLKKFDESAEYFRETYLIDPTFSPAKSDLPQEYKTDADKESEKP